MTLYYIANIRLPTEKAHGLQIMKTCEALAKQGQTVELMVPKRFNHWHQDPWSFYKVEKNFIITRLPCLDLISLRVFGRFGFWVESWTFFRSVKKYIKNKTGALYYTRDLSMAYWLSKIISPLFYEIHTLPEQVGVRYKQAWQKATGLIVISDGLKAGLVHHGLPLKKILVARDAVDLNQFTISESKEACRQKLNLPLNQKIIVYTGHLYDWKGAGILAKTAQNLPSNIHVYLVGGTAGDVERFRSVYKAKNLHIMGWQEHSLMPYWHKAADGLVLPNSATEPIGSRYTSPLKLFEYMASGTPIIASDVPALREILHEQNAWLVEPDQPGALARAITELLRNPAQYAILATNSYRDCQAYTWENRARLIHFFVLPK